MESLFKQKAIIWANTFDVCCVLDSHDYPDVHHHYDVLIAAGATRELHEKVGQAFDALQSFYDQEPQWMFGLLSYDLKNEVEHLQSVNEDHLKFPDMYFFVPTYLIAIRNGVAKVLRGDEQVLATIERTEINKVNRQDKINVAGRLTKEDYLKQVEALKGHINRGNCYEVTFCQEFFSNHATIDPLSVYQRLVGYSPTPFSGYFKIYDQYILSASPERFLCKRRNRLISQPIKGTAARHADPQKDKLLKLTLEQDEKERAENVMIVDLVRNDLTKVAHPGSVVVDELFGIYSFPQVHQMISTISCKVQQGLPLMDTLRYTFPMGSMTGAPKIKAMSLIDELENSKRGAFSGAIGYISPTGEFDFNVLIRTILYHATLKYLSFQVGGAITFSSDPEKEYEECLLKASAMLKALQD